jgi:hypothetical protein
MEVPQGNSFCSYLKQAKMSLFSSLFHYTKSENKSEEQALPGGFGTSGRGRGDEKGRGRVNIVQILCAYVCKLKNDIR